MADRQVGLAGLQRPFRIAVDPRRLQTNARRLRAHVRQHSRKQRDVARVGHADTEPPLRGGGIERDLPRREAPQRFENLPARPDQRIGLRRRRHAARSTYEQWVLQMLPQTPEPDADRRLTLPELLRHARDAAAS